MACHGCAQRRVVMRLVYEATKEWTANPTGPNVGVILVRLRDEAIARGELDPITGAIRVSDKAIARGELNVPTNGGPDGNLRQDT